MRYSPGTYTKLASRPLGYRRRRLLIIAILLLPCALAAADNPEVKYHKAIQLAREGHHDQALPLLRELAAAYPDKRDYLYDYITVLGWAERYNDELAQIPRVRLQDAPAYVLESLGHAERGVGDSARAVEYYRMAVNRAPNRADSVIGLAMSLVDQGKSSEALDLLKPFTRRHPNNTEGIASLAAAYENNHQLFEALAAYDRLLALNPDHREAQRQRIFITARMGAAPRALDMARSHPGLLAESEMDALTIDAAAKYLRWKDLYHPQPSARFEDIDRGIVMLTDLVNRLEKRGDGGTPLARRARLDLIVAFRDRNQPRQAVAIYEALQADKSEIPDYAEQAAADAYGSLHNPERARDIYLKLLQDRPDDFQLRMALYYTYFDLNEQERAYDIIDALAAAQTDPDLKLRSESSAAMARAWSGDLAEAQTRYEALTRAAPNNPYLNAELGYVYLWRGWPRRAMDQFRIGQAIEPEVLTGHLGEVDADRARNDFAAADPKIAALLAQYPDDGQIDKLRRSWEIHNMRELWVQSSATFSSGSQFGSTDLDLDTHLYSAPQKLHYRVFGHDYLAQATFPEGTATYHRFGAGLEYRARDVELSGELSDGFGRDAALGLALHGLWMADDHWRISGAYDSYSNDVPLRGRLNEDIDGWSLGANAEYRVHESRSFAAGLQHLEFSDGNQRTIESATAFQRLINRPRYKLDGRLAVYASQNTRDAASYYNPGSDLSLDASFINEWWLMHRYDRDFLHRLGLSLGTYEENGFSDKLVPGLFYEHEWRLYDRINLIYGIALNRPAYDGAYETHTRLYLNLHWRF